MMFIKGTLVFIVEEFKFYTGIVEKEGLYKTQVKVKKKCFKEFKTKNLFTDYNLAYSLYEARLSSNNF